MVSKWNLRCNIALACLAVITPSTCSAINVTRTVDYAPSATVHNGTLTGAYSAKYNQDFFLGVPFAQPPLGNLRLNLPHALNTSWTGSKEAVQYSPLCVGYGGDDVGYDVSEDCLTLNVIRPTGVSKDAELPVAVWIHGGGNVMGGSGDRRYNLSFIVENSVAINQPIIGVSINYRLSGFGFMYNDAIALSGLANLGLLDQRLALHWIQENIAAFGGSPRKVTIWGESAGGVSVGAHILAYGGRDDGLFRAAIAQSGGPAYLSRSSTRTARANSNSVTRATGCANVPDELACL
ncbi:hypothetical protein V500_08296 [Pseudogymnoascus sp. VKM F-4518 (FW-2643)]|nr:hypothetical protein V500_08296 [Pseudogymnoascus sp. VKM F-4518 (FW-2643)]